MKNSGDDIHVATSGWTFDGIEDSFDSHISKSVPLYLTAHELAVEASDFFIRDRSIVYDIGCSTGTFLNKLWARKKDKSPRLVGIDTVESMIQHAENNRADPSISFLCASVYEVDFDPSSMITSFYTIQFIPPSIRQDVINRVYNSLEWGGAFLFFEKVRAPDARFQDISSQLYTEFKMRNGYAADEILQKQMSLKSVLEPFSSQGNLELLKRAGFVDIMPIFRYVFFEGLLCIK